MQDLYWLYNVTQERWVIGRVNLYPATQSADVTLLGVANPVPLRRFSKRIPIKLPKRLIGNNQFSIEVCTTCPHYQPEDIGTDLEDTVSGGGGDSFTPSQDCQLLDNAEQCPWPHITIDSIPH